LKERRQHADLAFLLQGITFTVYSDGRGTERLFPFDLIPRIIPNSEWQRIDRGLAQRVVALNLFLQDVYGKQRIFADRQIHRSLVYSCKHFMREVIGIEVPRGFTLTSAASTWCAIPRPVNIACLKIMCARPAASRTCWKTAPS